MNSNITPGHVMAFQAITTGNFGTPSLWGCRVNGEAGACIVLTDRREDGRVAVMPLFVTIPPGMCLEMDGDTGEAEKGGGGPRTDEKQAVRQFRTQCQEMFGHAPR